MNEALRDVLASKKQQLQQKIKAEAAINTGILYHWLDYYEEMRALNMSAKVISLHNVLTEEVQLYTEVIERLGNPYIDAALITTQATPLLDQIFNRFPSTNYFKYEIDVPLVADVSGTIGQILSNAAIQLNIQPTEVYFLSNDFFPVVQINWSALLTHGEQLFNDGGRVTLLFTDPDRKWIIFRSIEEEWRCGFW